MWLWVDVCGFDRMKLKEEKKEKKLCVIKDELRLAGVLKISRKQRRQSSQVSGSLYLGPENQSRRGERSLQFSSIVKHHAIREGEREKKKVELITAPNILRAPEVSLVPGSPADLHSGLILPGRRISADDPGRSCRAPPEFRAGGFCGRKEMHSFAAWTDLFMSLTAIDAVSVNVALPKLLGIKSTRLQFHPAAPPICVGR